MRFFFVLGQYFSGKGVATILTFKQFLLSMDNKIRVLMGFVVCGQ